MSKKIAIDNNFFDAVYDLKDLSISDKIQNSFISKKLSLYPNVQLYSELLGLLQAEKRKEKIKQYASFLLNSMGYRVFNDWNKLIRIELGVIDNENIFLDKHTVSMFKKDLETLSKGQSVGYDFQILKWIDSHKDDLFKMYKNGKSDTEMPGDDLKRLQGISFDEYYATKPVIEWRKNLIRYVYVKCGKEVDDLKVERIICSSGFPYSNAYMKLEVALHYMHIVLDRKVDRGDSYDVYQMVYLTNLDHLITNDKRLKLLSELVFGDKNKVLNFTEFMEQLI